MKEHIPNINTWRGTGKAEEVYAKAIAGDAPVGASPTPAAAVTSAPAEPAPVAAKPAPVVKKAPAKKEPSRVEKGTLVEYSDYRNETIQISADDI